MTEELRKKVAAAKEHARLLREKARDTILIAHAIKVDAEAVCERAKKRRALMWPWRDP